MLRPRGSSALVMWVATSLLLLGSGSPAGGTGNGSPPPTQPAGGDPLAALGFAVTSGAAPGYVEDRACSAGGCHGDICRSFATMDKAWSSHRVRPERFTEDFDAPPLVHEASRRRYVLRRDGDRLVFSWYQLDGAGREINRLDQEVHWINGAGTLARTYFYRTPGGEIYQLPIAWYTRTRRFGMAPGFDRPEHEGVQRRVRRECQFCHNAYADLPAGGDAFSAPQVFPATLPEGIGCQRCHGPGAGHARLGLLAQRPGSGITAEALRASTVNPARLSAKLHNDVCYQCHARPSLAVPGLVRFGRGDFSFRPGEALSDFLVQVHVKKDAPDPAGHLGAISHPYRMEASRCFTASRGEVTCTMCHDSHRRLSAAEKASRQRAACLSCHGTKGCSRPAAEAASGAFEGDCIGCHMPARPSNVVDFPITDHLIVRRPADLGVEPQPRRTEPVLTEAWVTEPAGALGELYRTASLVRAVGGDEAIGALRRALRATGSQALEPQLILASGLLKRKRGAEAEAVLRKVLEKAPQLPLALQWMGLARGLSGKAEEAVELLRSAIPREPKSAEPRFNLGLYLETLGRPREAAEALEGALAQRPNMPTAWFHLGNAYDRLDRPKDAAAAYERALALDPAYSQAYARAGRVLVRAGRTAEARRVLEHGARVARNPAVVREALQELETVETPTLIP